MKRTFRPLLSMILAISLLFMATVPTFAARWGAEEYLSDIRIIYADSFTDAKVEVLESGLTNEYKVLSTNLNGNTGKMGVFIAYKTTTNIEDAITDIAVMQMNGGYNEGNYQEMIKQSYEDYIAMGDNYLTAINHFMKAYDAGNYLAQIAYRQLNFYNVVTEGIDNIPSFEGERIGDIFHDGIEVNDLATMFMEGNTYALDNIRSLIAMGVSYNEDGMTYLEKVAVEAGKYGANNDIYNNEDYGDLAKIIAPTITVFRNMFKEFEAHEVDLDYTDEEITDEELYYIEYKLMSEMAKDTNYLDGKTFYRFCMEYEVNNDDYSNLYPLVAALNEGQEAMTRVAHYYDVVRYSMMLTSSEDIEAELAELEERYSENPFNIYTGVDRTIYKDTFALTSEAYRADAYTESGLSAALYDGNLPGLNIAATVVGSIGAACMAYGLGRYGYSFWSAKNALDAYDLQYDSLVNSFAATNNISGLRLYENTTEAIQDMFSRCYNEIGSAGNALYQSENIANLSLSQKFSYLERYCNVEYINDEVAASGFLRLKGQFDVYQSGNQIYMSARDAAQKATENLSTSSSVLKGCFIVGGIMMVVSAIKLGYSIWHYYHPDYTDIPTAMVDLVETVDGDRYIKYDVVYELLPQSDGTLIAGDLNAFSAERWNALYYTKSYEAGKPLLAGEFEVSNKNNVPDKNYMPVHRFGEVVCYNLNKYNFDDDYSIYLSVRQSDKQKAAIADVPEVVGSVLGTGYILLAGGAGAAVGVGGTIGVFEIMKRRKKKETHTNEENV